MADIAQLETALRNADAAGDKEAARMLAAEIVRQRGSAAAPANPEINAQSEQPKPKSQSFAKRFMQGLADPGLGLTQLMYNMTPDFINKPLNNLDNYISEKTGIGPKISAGGYDEYMRNRGEKIKAENTGTGFDAARLVGNVANPLTLLPAAKLPAALTAGGKLLTGAGLGAASGAIAPVESGDFFPEKLKQVGIGAAVGGAIPVVTGGVNRTAKVLRAGLIDPFTDAGRTKIVGGALNRAAANPAEAAGNMSMSSGATQGFLPTAGQASNDAGIASLERAARAIDPAGFGDIDSTQKAALVNALRGVAKSPEERATAVAARENAVKPMYKQAKKAVVESDAAIEELLKRPSMAAAKQRAAALAAERGDNFAITPSTPPQQVASGILDAQGNPIINTIPGAPGKLQGTALHDLKMGLDDAIGSPGVGGMQGAERNAALSTKADYMNWLEQQIPDYAEAKNAYSAASTPINQMDIGQELFNRFVPPLSEGMGVPISTRAASLAQALRNGDQLAQRVTGMKAAKFDQIMSPQQREILSGVVEDSQNKAFAESAGRGVGSDTVQKMAMSNMIEQAGLPSWIGALKPLGSVGGMARTLGDIVYTKNDENMRYLLADILKDPARAAAAMKNSGIEPSKYAEILKRAEIFGAPGAATAAATDR